MYLKPDDLYQKEKPFISQVPFLSKNSRGTNLLEEPHEMRIRDVRGLEELFSLDVQGFQYLTHDFSHKPDHNIDNPDHPYLSEVAEMLKTYLQADLVQIYDCNVSNYLHLFPIPGLCLCEEYLTLTAT